MTTNPPTLAALGAYWVANGGINLGVVGNAAHTSGYHLGRDRIYDGSGPGLGDADYSVQHIRDKTGLTNAASAIDLGRLGGSLAALRAFTRDLVARCLTDSAVRRDIREIIYSPDGIKVQRYSGLDNRIHTGPGNGDASHRGHSHISYLRDSRARDKITAFRPYFEDALVNTYPVPLVPSIGDIAKGVVLYPSDALIATDPARIIIDPARSFPYLGQPSMAVRIVAYVDEAGVPSGKAYFVKRLQITNIRPVPAPVPDCSAPVAAARLAGARAEWDRQQAGATVAVALAARP